MALEALDPNAQNQNATVTVQGADSSADTAAGVPMGRTPAATATVPGSTKAITDWYQNTLGRAPDQAGLDYWSKAFGDTLDPAELASLNATTEAKNRAAVNDLYKTELGRTADQPGYNYWINQLNSGASLQDVTKAFNAAPEAQIYDIYKQELGRAPDVTGGQFWQGALSSGKTPDEIRAEIAKTEEGRKYDISTDYQDLLGRKAQDPELKYWLDLTNKGLSIDQVKDMMSKSPEAQVVQDYRTYLGREPDAAGLAYWQQQIASGKSPQEVARAIALSSEGVKTATNDLTTILNTQLDKSIVSQLTPNQLKDFATQFADPNQNANDKLKTIYTKIATDPVLGSKLKETNPFMYESFTPLTQIDPQTNGRIQYGYFGMYNKAPILNASAIDQALGGGNVVSNFSHDRGRGTIGFGWTSNSFSDKITKGADALGATKNINEDGSTDYTGLDQAASILKINKDQFKDKQVQDVTKDQYDENGNLVQKGGEPAFTTDETGKKVPVMKTITAQDQLYDAINKASQNLYSVTMDTMDPAHKGEGDPKSFQTVMYQKVGDKLLAISDPVSHGGMQNFDVYNPQDNGFGTALTMMVGMAAMVVAPELAGVIGPALEIGEGVAAVASGILVGAGVGAANATIAGKSIGDASLKGGTIGGITAGLSQGLDTMFPPTIAADGTKIANSIFTNASELMNGAVSPAGIQSVVSQTLARTLATAAQGANGDKILDTLGTALVSSGLSVAASEQLVNQLKDAGFDKDNISKLSRAVQIAVNTGTTGALTGKSSDQILQSIITSVVSSAPNILSGTTTTKTDTNGRDEGSTGLTTGAVDKKLIDSVIDQNATDISNTSKDPIETMNSIKNWTGDAKNNLVHATGEMINQGMDATTISQNLQDFYKISQADADAYARYMVNQSTQLVGPTQTTTTTKEVNPTTTRELTRDREAGRDVVTPTTTTKGPTTPLISGFGQTVTPTASNINWETPTATKLATVNPSTGTNVGFAGQIGSAAATLPALSSVGEALSSYGSQILPEVASAVRGLTPAMLALMPSQIGSEEAMLREMYNQPSETAGDRGKPITVPTTTLPGKPTTEGYGGVPFSPADHVAPPRPLLGEAAPSGFAPGDGSDVTTIPAPVGPVVTPGTSPAPANEPTIWDPNAVPAPNTFTPAGTAAVATPTAPTPGKLPLPVMPTVPEVKPVQQPVEQPVEKPVVKPTEEVKPETKTVVTPQVQQAIQTVAKTAEEAQALTKAVPVVQDLIGKGITREVAIPQVATQFSVPVDDLTSVINVAIPVEPKPVVDVTKPTPTPTPTSTTKPKLPTSTLPAVLAASSAPLFGAPDSGTPKATFVKGEQIKLPMGEYDIPMQTMPTPISDKDTLEEIKNAAQGGLMHLATGGSSSASSTSNEPTAILTKGSQVALAPTTYNIPVMTYGTPNAVDKSLFELPKSAATGGIMHMAEGGDMPMNAIRMRGQHFNYNTPFSGMSLTANSPMPIRYHAEGGQIAEHNPQFFSEGGLGAMQNTYVKGQGDGTSDSIPAMLANGEFVIPADVVSSLGNGSNDSGAKVLDEFLKTIRQHKTRAGKKGLPPDSKGPLGYLLEAKRKARA